MSDDFDIPYMKLVPANELRQMSSKTNVGMLQPDYETATKMSLVYLDLVTTAAIEDAPEIQYCIAMTPDQARWLAQKLVHSSFGAEALDANTPTDIVDR